MGSVLCKKTTLTKYQDIAALLCLIAAVIFFCLKAHYGFGLDDESNYLTIPHRLLMGDSLLTDEWNVDQLIGFLLYLPAKAYVTLAGSTEGIILFFRYLFIALQSVVSAVIYLRFRKYGIFALFAGLVFFLHIPMTIMSLSYYAMGIAFVTLIGVLMATTKKISKVTFYTVGLLMAFAVLCNPVLFLVYFLYSVCMIINEKNKNKKRPLFGFSAISFSFKTWLWITFGVSTVAITFFVFLFSRTNLSEIIKNFPMLFTDPEYNFSFKGGTQNIFTVKETLLAIININPYLFSAFAILIAVIIFDNNRVRHRRFLLMTGSVLFFVYIAVIVNAVDFPYFGYLMFPLALFGLTCYLLSEIKNKDIFVFLWVLGVLYSVCLDIASEVGYLTSYMGLTISSVASAIFIKNIIDELRKKSKVENIHKDNNINALFLKLLTLALSATLVFQIFQECYIVSDFKLYTEYLVSDSNVKAGASLQKDSKEKLNVTIQTGPEKGLKTTAARANVYNGIIRDLRAIKENGKGPVLIASNMPWCYLYLNRPYATYSTWFESYNFNGEKLRLLDYYKLHPEKTPEYIYLPKAIDLVYINYPEKVKEILTGLKESFTFTIKESVYGYTLKIIK